MLQCRGELPIQLSGVAGSQAVARCAERDMEVVDESQFVLEGGDLSAEGQDLGFIEQ